MGDLNGDGVGDLAVGATNDDDGGIPPDANRGAVWILFLNGVPECPADLSGDGIVEAFDLAMLLGAWGPCPEPFKEGYPADTCPADLSGDCVVEAFDLALLLGAWGPCE